MLEDSDYSSDSCSCIHCGYNLESSVPNARCPECGAANPRLIFLETVHDISSRLRIVQFGLIAMPVVFVFSLPALNRDGSALVMLGLPLLAVILGLWFLVGPLRRLAPLKSLAMIPCGALTLAIALLGLAIARPSGLGDEAVYALSLGACACCEVSIVVATLIFYRLATLTTDHTRVQRVTIFGALACAALPLTLLALLFPLDTYPTPLGILLLGFMSSILAIVSLQAGLRTTHHSSAPKPPPGPDSPL